ncbi:MAG: hypothetical protein Q9191_003677, partial [Dirinaria sp. TL-2023a]
LFALRRKEALKKANITHVVSALTLPIDRDLFQDYKHLVVEVHDLEDENILQHFPTTNAFIRAGLDGGGGVLVHCAMGKSRSAAFLIAYLLFLNPTLDFQSALGLIRRCRPSAEPNSGFMSQLELYHRMQCPEDPDSSPLYQRWLYHRNVEASRAAGLAPEAGEIQFGELTSTTPSNDETKEVSSIWRCRRCRTPLATSDYVVTHTPRTTSFSPSKPSSTDSSWSLPSTLLPTCSHLFLDPLSWMRPELEKGLLSGRLECPNRKCEQNVGKYAWQGMKCTCGEWVVPAISIARGRVDEVHGSRKIARKGEGEVGKI